MKQGAVLLGTLLLVFLPGSARGVAAGPRLTDDGRTLILLDEVREPQEKRQPGITLAGDRVTGGRQVRIAGHGIASLREIAAVCGTRSWRVGLSDFRQTPETNVATYDVPGEVVIQMLGSPECSLLIAGARLAIPRELVSAVWGLPGSAQQPVPGSSAAASAPTATPAESCAVRMPGGDPSRIPPGERAKAVKAIEALGALVGWASGSQSKDKAEYATRVANTDKLVGEYLAGGQQGGQGELASAIRAAMSCFKEALRVWPNVNQSWLSAAENVRGVERYLNVKSLAERQEEERTRRTEVEAKQQEVKHREATKAKSLDRSYASEPTAPASSERASVTSTQIVEFIGKKFELKFKATDKPVRIYEYFLSNETPENWLEMVAFEIYPVHPEGNEPMDHAKRTAAAFKQKYPYMQFALFTGKNTDAALLDFFFPESTRKEKDKNFLEFNAFKFFRSAGSPYTMSFHYVKNIEGTSASRPMERVSSDIKKTRQEVVPAIARFPLYRE